MMPTQQPQDEWADQWTRFFDESDFLFTEWIQPRTYADFAGQVVLDAGCGPGHHILHVAPHAKQVIGVDLNTLEIAQHNTAHLNNVEILRGDLAHYRPTQPVDVLYCIGVIHHTDDPDATFENLYQCLRPGGLMIIWCYAQEGNELVRSIVEPLRKQFLVHLPRTALQWLSWFITLSLYPIIYSVYLLPIRRLPFYQYFENWRKLSPRRNMMNVFDKLNAPQTHFISRQQVDRWFDASRFDDVQIRHYKGVSYSASGYKRPADASEPGQNTVT